jgi:hypothetical protein
MLPSRIGCRRLLRIKTCGERSVCPMREQAVENRRCSVEFAVES